MTTFKKAVKGNARQESGLFHAQQQNGILGLAPGSSTKETTPSKLEESQRPKRDVPSGHTRFRNKADDDLASLQEGVAHRDAGLAPQLRVVGGARRQIKKPGTKLGPTEREDVGAVDLWRGVCACGCLSVSESGVFPELGRRRLSLRSSAFSDSFRLQT